MYYVKDNHIGIVSRKTFHKVQEELARRNSRRSPSQKNSVTGQGKYSKYALTDLVRCAECGTKYRRVTWYRNGGKKFVWRCCNRLDYGTQFCKDSPTLLEADLQAAIVRAMSSFSKKDNERFHQHMLDSIADAVGLDEDNTEITMLTRQIEEISTAMVTLVELSVKEGLDVADSEDSFLRMSEEIEQLTARLEAVKASGKTLEQRLAEEERLKGLMDRLNGCTSEYNDNAVRQMIECIKVYPDGKLDIIFAGGYTIVEHIEVK